MLTSEQEDATVCSSATPHLAGMSDKCLSAALHFVVLLAVCHVTISLNLKKSRHRSVSCIHINVWIWITGDQRKPVAIGTAFSSENIEDTQVKNEC